MRDHNNDKVNFEVLNLHARCTIQKQFKVEHLVYMPEREKLKTQNCKRIGQKARVLHDRKRMLKQSELQITEQENCSYLLQNEIYVVIDGASRERESFDIWRHRNPFLTTYGPPTFFFMSGK